MLIEEDEGGEEDDENEAGVGHHFVVGGFIEAAAVIVGLCDGGKHQGNEKAHRNSDVFRDVFRRRMPRDRIEGAGAWLLCGRRGIAIVYAGRDAPASPQSTSASKLAYASSTARRAAV